MFAVIVASLGYAGGVVADKFVLCKYKVPVMRLLPLQFIWLSIITAIFLTRWGSFDMGSLLEWKYIVLFVLMILIAVNWNILYSQGIQKEDLHEFELIMLLSPLVTIIFATIFLPAERNWSVFVPGIIATGALLATRFRAHHVRISKVAWRTLIAMVLMSLESIIIKELLGAFSPVALYFARTTIIAVVFLFMFKPKLLEMHRNAFALAILSAIFGVVQMVLKFYGFQSLGVIETTMILVLGPFLVYLAASMFFKEHIYKRDIFAAAVVVMCILYVQFWR